MELALYDPQHGFYETAAGAGRSGSDFLTSPEVGPLFGVVLARALDSWWQGLGRPDPFVVVEVGAGQGSLAAAVISAVPACSAALRYVLVERSATLRRRLAARLPLEPPSQVLGSVAGPADPEEPPRPEPGLGPLITAVEALPRGPFAGVVLANELLDNIPFRLVERREEGWADILVTAELDELAVPAPAAVAQEAGELAPSAPPGGRIPLQHGARDWLAEALGRLSRGRVAVIDYASTTENMARRPWRDWCRTYRGQAPGGHPLEDLGLQDITCEVAVDQLAAVHPWTASGDQAGFLASHGLEALVQAARREWREGAAVGDLPALTALSRVQEAAALTDPSGLGAFRVLEWEVGPGRR